MINPSDFIAALVADFYKTGHLTMIPDDVSEIYLNMTARSMRLQPHADGFDDSILLVGTQRMLDDLHMLWQTGFFLKSKSEVLRRIRRRLVKSMPTNVDVQRIVSKFGELHDIGFLPIVVKSLDEGTRVPVKVPFMTMKATDSRFVFLPSFLETIMSCESWKTIVNATTAFEFRRVLSKNALETTGSDAGVVFQGHDFSMRGMSGFVDATNTGIGHLSCFRGTDTMPAIDAVESHYDPDEDTFIGGSVPATEHMVMCINGKDGEEQTFRRLITELFPTGIISIVSDTWDFFGVVTDMILKLKPEIMARKADRSGFAKVVLRPDSGDPVKIICGDPQAPVGSPEHKGTVECLWDIFGGTVTPQGFRVLDPHIGVIYGDSITLQRMLMILKGLRQKGFATTNVIFGIGSFTYQFVTRDNGSIAVKATLAIRDGREVNLLKDPKTDGGTKKSATGFLRVDLVDGRYVLTQNATLEQEAGGELRVRYENGQFHNRIRWEQLTDNVEAELLKFM